MSDDLLFEERTNCQGGITDFDDTPDPAIPPPPVVDQTRPALLIVDADAGLATVMALIARDAGWQVRVEHAGETAVTAFLRHPADAIAVEMVLPGMDGIDVIHAILSAGHAPDIIALSGLSPAYLRLAEGLARFHGLDGIATLAKPFTRIQFESRLRAAAPRR